MNLNEKLWNVCKEIYVELFKKAEPEADFNEMLKTGETIQKEFFMMHYLSKERQQNIIDEIVKKYKLSEWESEFVNLTIHLGCSPECVKLSPRNSD